MHTEPVARPFVLRFPVDIDPGYMQAVVTAWGERFARHWEGAGFFPAEPEIEAYPEVEPHGVEGRCYAFYLRADSRLWAQISSSRTLTVDEPVLARQVACR